MSADALLPSLNDDADDAEAPEEVVIDEFELRRSTSAADLLRGLPRARDLRGRIPGLASWAACFAAVVVFTIQDVGDTTLLEYIMTIRSPQHQLPIFSSPGRFTGSAPQDLPHEEVAQFKDLAMTPTLPSHAAVHDPIPIPVPSPHPPPQSLFEKITQFCHDYFYLLLLLLVLLEMYVLPRTGLSWGFRSATVFTLCSVLIAVAQGFGSMIVYWLAMALILLVFYGDLLMELSAISPHNSVS